MISTETEDKIPLQKASRIVFPACIYVSLMDIYDLSTRKLTGGNAQVYYNPVYIVIQSEHFTQDFP